MEYLMLMILDDDDDDDEQMKFQEKLFIFQMN